MPSGLNDDFLNRLALDFGFNGQQSAAILIEQLVSVVQAKDYRREDETFRLALATSGNPGPLTVAFDLADKEEDLLFHIGSFDNISAAAIQIDFTVLNDDIPQLQQYRGRTIVTSGMRATIIGKQFRDNMFAGNAQDTPEEILLPRNSRLVLDFFNAAGGAIPLAAAMTLELTATRVPSLRSWTRLLETTLVQP